MHRSPLGLRPIETGRTRAAHAARVLLAAACLGLVGVAAGIDDERDDAPRVVATVPAHGTAGLDPELIARLVVEFDRPMRRGSHSWVRGGLDFPETTGPPTWLDERRAVLPVRLVSGRDEAVSVNGGRFRNFRSADGVSARPTPIVFSTRPHVLEPGDAERTLVALRARLPACYSYADRLGIDWPSRIDDAAESLLASPSGLALAVRIAALLDEAEDPHLSVALDGRALPGGGVEHRRAQRDLELRHDGRVLAGVLRAGTIRQHEHGIATALAADGVGFIVVPTWSGAGTGDAAVRALAALEREHGPLDALVIDVRPNGGGDETEARRLARCFVHHPVIYARRRVMPACGASLVDVPAVLEAREVGHAPEFTRRPVAVLAGPGTMSSCEAFVLMMRAAGATIVGRPTFGSSGNPQPHDLGAGIEIRLPSWIALDANGTPFEGPGIAPDVLVEAAPSAEAGDPVLAAALERLRTGD